MEPTVALSHLIRATHTFFKERLVEERLPMLDTVVKALAIATETELSPASPNARLPVQDTLHAIKTRSHDDATATLLDAFIATADVLSWVQTESYKTTMSQRYLDNYGYVRLVGPGEIIESAHACVGIGVWGAGLHYPAHHHEAEEVYFVLAGNPQFRTGDEPFETKAITQLVHHAPWEIHEQIFDELCVMAYAWTGNVLDDATLV